ncbi:UBX domain-containing protein 7 [Lamellibrachia satsuma]|nr:UBX domain-containing protein 7 [Lamellibrachia satsuma]
MEECESRESATNERSVIEKFCAITGASEDVAGRLLEACGGNIDLAIGMHLDSAEEGRESPHQETSGEDAGDVRAPIPQKNEKLVEESHSVPTFGRRKRTTNCIFDALRDFEAETRVQEEREGGPSGAAANKCWLHVHVSLVFPPWVLTGIQEETEGEPSGAAANKWIQEETEGEPSGAAANKCWLHVHVSLVFPPWVLTGIQEETEGGPSGAAANKCWLHVHVSLVFPPWVLTGVQEEREGGPSGAAANKCWLHVHVSLVFPPWVLTGVQEEREGGPSGAAANKCWLHVHVSLVFPPWVLTGVQEEREGGPSGAAANKCWLHVHVSLVFPPWVLTGVQEEREGGPSGAAANKCWLYVHVLLVFPPWVLTGVQEEREGGPSGAAANKRRTLQDLFRPPLDLIHKGTFQSTRMAASQANKWLLINIQNAQEFCCQILNRDVWSSSKVKTIVRRHFIFWQGYHDSSEGQRFMQFYNINTWPYIAVLDPRTGEKMAVWHTRDADTLTELLREFTEQYPAPDGSAVEPPNKVQRRRDSIMDASEESQLETAIRLSLTETNKDKRPDLDLNVLTDDDDTDDMLETFSSSDSDTERPKQSCYSIKGSSTRSSPAAAAAAAGSETASRQNQSEANTYESEDGASNCVCVNGAESAASTPDVPPCQDNSREPPTVDHSRQNSGGETHRSIGHGSDKSVGHHSLPGRSSVDEGSLSNGSTTRVQIRFPDGLKKVLALPKCSSVQTLTQFVEKQGYPTVDYKLVTTFPKRQLSQMSPGSTLEDIGFCSQEIVYVQSVS